MKKFSETSPALESGDFQRLEEVMGIAFPNDLRHHYEIHNGGRPEESLFVGRDDEYNINEFLPIKYGIEGERLEDTYVALVKNNEFFPNDVIPFASDGGGDFFCYCLDKSRMGNIIFYQADYYYDPARSVVWLASSFDEFLNATVRRA